jgi:hypothetical protein
MSIIAILAENRVFLRFGVVFHFRQRILLPPSAVVAPQELPGKTGYSERMAIAF